MDAEILWAGVEVLDHASEYLCNDAGERDIFWTPELDEAVKLLQHKADLLRKRAVKAGR
jgi:hypothetical protein